LVPAENLTFGGLKLLGLLVLPASQAAWLPLTWSVPAFLVVAAVTLVIFKRVAPQYEADRGAPSSPLPLQELRRYFWGEQLANTISVAAPLLFPVIVLHKIGTERSAYFYLPWVIGSACSLLLWNVMTAFTAEAMARPETFKATLSRTLRLGSAITASVLVGLVLATPLVLSLLGTPYLEQSTGLLLYLALSLPFALVIYLRTAFCAVDGQAWTRAGIQALLAVATLSSATFVDPADGLGRFGLTYLVAQAAVAAVLLPWLLRRIPRELHPDGQPGSWRRLALAAARGVPAQLSSSAAHPVASIAISLLTVASLAYSWPPALVFLLLLAWASSAPGLAILSWFPELAHGWPVGFTVLTGWVLLALGTAVMLWGGVWHPWPALCAAIGMVLAGSGARLGALWTGSRVRCVALHHNGGAPVEAARGRAGLDLPVAISLRAQR
jgi:hypothetical protein